MMSIAEHFNNEAFHSYASKLSKTSDRFGIKHSYNPHSDHFSKLPIEAKKVVIDNLKRYTDFLSELETLEIDITDSSKLLKHSIEYLRFHLPPDVYNKVSPTDQFELFTSDGVPFFKSPKSNEFTSYNLDVVLSTPYNELYARDEFYQASIHRAAMQILKGEKVMIERPIPEHIAWETRGPIKCNIRYKLMCPFYFNSSTPDGVLVVFELTKLSS